MKPEERYKMEIARIKMNADNLGYMLGLQDVKFVLDQTDLLSRFKNEYNPNEKIFSYIEIRDMKITRDFLKGKPLRELAELYDLSSSRIGIIIRNTAKRLYKNHKEAFLWELGLRNSLRGYDNYLIEKINKKIGV